jgi:hypothetical protein
LKEVVICRIIHIFRLPPKREAIVVGVESHALLNSPLLEIFVRVPTELVVLALQVPFTAIVQSGLAGAHCGVRPLVHSTTVQAFVAVRVRTAVLILLKPLALVLLAQS